ncbi:MAG: glycosyltransferase [Desulfuromonadaceae bacterium]
MNKSQHIIGIDARTLYFPDSTVRGVGQYSFSHIQAIISLKPEWNFILFGMTPTPPPCLEQFKSANISFKHYSEYDPKDVDLVHICDPMTIMDGYVSPVKLFPHARRTMTFYDLIPLSFYFDQWPELRRISYTERLAEVASGNSVFLSISEFTRHELLRHLGTQPDNVVTIMAGANHIQATLNRLFDREEIKVRLGITKPFFLHVGALDPHKNFETVIKSFAELHSQEDVLLVVVGELSGSLLEYARWFRERGVCNVLFTGFLDRSVLEILYHEALALLFLSRCEGFGLPVLEAMIHSCPVITTNVSSIPEVAGDAALLFDPDDVVGITGAMHNLIREPEIGKTLRERGLLQSRKFSWELTAEKTIAVWEWLLQSGSHPAQTPRIVNSPIKVLYDISVLGLAHYDQTSRTGVFRVVEHIARGLAASSDIDLHFCSTQHFSEYAPHTALACREYLAEHTEFSNVPFHETHFPVVDIFHSPFHPLPPHTNAAIRFQTVYDLIPILQPQLFLGRYNPLTKVIAGITPNDHALCISSSTLEDLCRVTGMGRNHAHVTYIAADPAIFCPCMEPELEKNIRQKYNIGIAPYMLSLCTLEPRKNIDHVIRAFARLVREERAGDTRLVLTGTRGWDFERIFSEIDNNPELHSRIVLTGYVPDEELSPLYTGAIAFIYMSLYEGFGLPPLEAMRCGVPVITSKTSSLPEVVGDAGIMLDPQDLDGLCQAMQKVIANSELRDEMAQCSLQQSERFSWDRCVKETIDVYREALNNIAHVLCSKKTVDHALIQPPKIYFYRPEIDFSLDSRVCYILAPLILGTSLENEYEVKTDPAQWRFHPISHDWRNNPMWAGYQYDPDLFAIAETPEDADLFVFPYLLDEMIECAGGAPVASWLCQLPYYKGAENRHLFMTLHDSSEQFRMEALFFRASIKPSGKDSRAYALPYPVENFQSRLHFDPERIIHEVSFVGFMGDSTSGPVRHKIVDSLQQTALLRTFVSASARFHGFEEATVRTERRELFINSLAESWLVICPRGTGENSYRFFETLSMGRIPVLLSDDCLLPFENCINYDSIILRIPEKAADRTAEILHQWLSSQTVESLVERCRLARRIWEQYFACPQWNRRIIETLLPRETQGRIIIDGVIFQLQYGRPFGISRLWLSLLTEVAATPLAQRIILLDRDGTAPAISGIKRRNITAFQLGNACSEAAVLDRICAEEHAKLFISTYYTFTNETPSLLMLYDMIPERFQDVGPDVSNPEWRDKYHAIANSSAFAAISDSTARDLATFYPQAAQRPLTVIPCAVSDDFRTHSEEEIAAFKAASSIDRPYFLLVGRRDTHKNAALFFQAFARLPNRGQYAVVMGGGGNALEPELRELVGPAAGYAGFFSDQDLSLAYSGAIALVYPSIYEGFGLPILEAMQSGCPVITCQNSSLPEVAGSAALYVGEFDCEEMSRALLSVQQPDVRSYLIKRGLERARLFSWRKSAELLAEAIQKTVAVSGEMHISGSK